MAGWLICACGHFDATEASQNSLPKAAFLPTDPQIRHPCLSEGCAPDWTATGRDGVAYRLVRVGAENRHTPLVLAVPEVLLDRFPFPECDLVSTSATAGLARPPGTPPTPAGCKAGVTSRVALVATLPDFKPAGRASIFDQEERTDLVTMVIDVTRADSDFRRGLSTDRSGGLENWLTAWGTAMARKGFMMARKPSLFGLSRLGPMHGLQGRDAAILSDVLFTGEAVGGSPDVLMCTVEEALRDDGQLKPGLKPPQASCWQWFAVPELGVEVRLSYDRRHLPNWQTTKAAALAQVTRFAQTANPRP